MTVTGNCFRSTLNIVTNNIFAQAENILSFRSYLCDYMWLRWYIVSVHLRHHFLYGVQGLPWARNKSDIVAIETDLIFSTSFSVFILLTLGEMKHRTAFKSKYIQFLDANRTLELSDSMLCKRATCQIFINNFQQRWRQSSIFDCIPENSRRLVSMSLFKSFGFTSQWAFHLVTIDISDCWAFFKTFNWKSYILLLVAENYLMITNLLWEQETLSSTWFSKFLSREITGRLANNRLILIGFKYYT